MIIKQPSHSSYLSRTMTLPLLFILFSASSFQALSSTAPNGASSPGIFPIEVARQKADTGILPAQEFMKIIEKERAEKGAGISFRSNPSTDQLNAKLPNGEIVTTRLSEAVKVAPRLHNDSSTIFTKMEIEASYPGGQYAWMRFLNKTFRYPAAAQAAEIQGTVIVEFIVDKEGNTSNIQAISGPEAGGLREEALKIIKASGKWIPAMQSGYVVSSYKKQPFIFRLDTQ